MERRFSSSDWSIIIAAALLLVASVLPWWQLRFDEALDFSLDAWDFPNTGRLPVLILVVIAALTVIIRTESLRLPHWLVDPYLVTLAVGVAGVLIGVRFSVSDFEEDERVTRGVGLYVAVAAVLLALVGCGLAIRERRRPVVRSDDDDDDAAAAAPAGDVYGYSAEPDDDLAGRFNAAIPTDEAPVLRPRQPAPPQATPPRRPPTPRRRGQRVSEGPPATRTRRRPRDASPG